ncbi:uncharacterized protein LOC134665573 isoform X1 [Cydia fagiglandana]|uniref:uncharacterized protein LOC134665573 isoform X1 n=1 Tax=Cydia fagiglandana TaxID=1458189 RepID=UPI002FEE1755
MSDTEQKEAIAARGRAKGSITRLKNSFDREALINSPIELVLAKKTRLLEAFREYERLTSKVASLFSSPPATLATDDEEVEDNYILLLAQLESIINVIRLRDNPPQASPSVSVKSENLKLPRVVIKTFTVVKQHLAALQNLGEPVDKWDAIIICILSKKIDLPTYRAFQLERDKNVSPTVKEFLGYVEKRALAFENTDVKGPSQSFVSRPEAAQAKLSAHQPQRQCLYCKCAHRLYNCPSFNLASIHKRMEFASTNNLCKICLSQHKRKCKFHFRCKVCKLQHNSLLHQDKPTPSVTLSATRNRAHNIVLPSARVKLITKSGRVIYCKALLDGCSQASFITQKIVDKLGLPMQNTSSKITGINNAKHAIDKCINLDVHSAVYPFKINVNCKVVDKITTKLPQIPINKSHITLPTNCKLADENFNKHGDVDLLLDAGVFFQILLTQTKNNGDQATKQPIVTAGTPSTSAPSLTTSSAAASSTSIACAATPQGPTLVQTSFGVIIGGRLQLPARKKSKQVISLLCTECNEYQSDLSSAFGETKKVTEIFLDKIPEQDYCEKPFRESTKLADNKYEVSQPNKFPLEQEVNSELGKTSHLALNGFLNLEKRLHVPQNQTLFTKYHDGHGQLILHNEDCIFSEYSPLPTELPELKADHTSALCLTTTVHNPDLFEIIKKFSTIAKMTCVLAYILRFCNNVKPTSQNLKDLTIVKHEKAQFLSNDLRMLQSDKQLKGNLNLLTPFLDGEGIIRVGGRLQNASLPYAAQHPAILPKQSPITNLLARNEHICLLDARQNVILCYS